MRPKLLRLVLPNYHKHVRPETHGATNDTIRNLALEDDTVVVAPPCYPVLKLATSGTTWFMVKAGIGSPTVEASEFVTLLLDLGLAQKDKGELVMKEQDTQKIIRITLTVLYTNDDGPPKNGLKNGLRSSEHSDLQFGKVKKAFDRHVKVEARNLWDYFDKEDRRTLELWNYFEPYVGSDPLETIKWML